jgi:hypothetical protein
MISIWLHRDGAPASVLGHEGLRRRSRRYLPKVLEHDAETRLGQDRRGELLRSGKKIGRAEPRSVHRHYAPKMVVDEGNDRGGPIRYRAAANIKVSNSNA